MGILANQKKTIQEGDTTVLYHTIRAGGEQYSRDQQGPFFQVHTTNYQKNICKALLVEMGQFKVKRQCSGSLIVHNVRCAAHQLCR